MNRKYLTHLIIFVVVFVQIFTPAIYAADATNANTNAVENLTIDQDNVVDDAPMPDTNEPYKMVTADNIEDMTAQAAILIDATTGRVLYERNADKKELPASTTKMMTAILALENSNEDDVVSIDDRAIDEDGSSIYLHTGDKMKMGELLQATMLASGNDGADAIAYYIGDGSLEKFVQMMNDKAKEIGTQNTHFNNPHGLTDKNHYSSARDLAKIAAYGMEKPEFRKIVSTKEQIINWEQPQGRTEDFGSTNRLLWNYDDVLGIKTGYTEAAGGCLVTAAKQDGVTLIAVVLKTVDSRARFIEGRALLDYGFKQIAKTKSVDKAELTHSIFVHDGVVAKTAVSPAEDVIFPVLKDENEDDFTYKENLPTFIKAPTKKGDKVGTVDVFYQGNQIGSIDLVANEDINEGFNLLGFLHSIFFH